MAAKETIVYTAASLSSLEDLETTCERDEAYLGKIVKIELARLESNTGEKAVAVTYEEVSLGSGINLGHLIFSSYTNELDAARRASELTAAGHRPVFADPESKTKAFIGNATINFVAFRQQRSV